jgi:hypothetical protein
MPNYPEVLIRSRRRRWYKTEMLIHIKNDYSLGHMYPALPPELLNNLREAIGRPHTLNTNMNIPLQCFGNPHAANQKAVRQCLSFCLLLERFSV